MLWSNRQLALEAVRIIAENNDVFAIKSATDRTIATRRVFDFLSKVNTDTDGSFDMMLSLVEENKYHLNITSLDDLLRTVSELIADRKALSGPDITEDL